MELVMDLCTFLCPNATNKCSNSKSLSLNSTAELEEGLHFSFMHSTKEKTIHLSYLETQSL